MRVLVVDDNEELLQFMVQSLSEVVVEAVGAKNGAEAMELVQAEKFDGIVIDATLGDSDGISLAQQIREHKNGRNVPLLIMSSFATPLARRMAKSVGCDDILVKPCGMGQFIERVKTLR
jgi:DNA-binding response OmpR family regulator